MKSGAAPPSTQSFVLAGSGTDAVDIRPPHRARSVALLAATAAAGALTLTTPAQAVIGDAVADSAYAFTAQIQIGEGDTSRACTGSLVDAQYVLTASSCFAAAGQLLAVRTYWASTREPVQARLVSPSPIWICAVKA